MRAVLNIDPQKGPGYGILSIEGADDTGQPILLIRRMSDNMYLGDGGWSAQSLSITPESWQNSDDSLRIWLNPDIIDNLTKGVEYELTLSGIGTCALQINELSQSWVVDENGQDAYAPPPAWPSPPLEQEITPENAIAEGVEKTPFDAQILDDSAGPAGVAAATDAISARKGGKKFGCLLLSAVFFMIWLGGGVYLWQKTLSTSFDDDEDSKPFEFIPSSEESSVVDDKSGKN